VSFRETILVAVHLPKKEPQQESDGILQFMSGSEVFP